MPRRLKAVAVDRAEPCKHSSANVIQFKRSSSFEDRASQRLDLSDGGDPGPAGFDWNELKRF